MLPCAVIVGWGLVFGGGSAARAQDQPSLDELLDLTPRSDDAIAPTEGQPDEAGDASDPNADLQDALTGPTLKENFELAVAEMGQVTRRLDGRDPGLPTQRLQQRILDRLEQLVSAASSSSSSSSSSSGSGQPQPSDGDNQQNQPGQQGSQGQQPQPGQGQTQAQPTPGGADPNQGQFSPGSVGPVDASEKSLDELRSEWGALPPRLRDELTDGLDEPYSPVYRDATEAYYRRLAEEAGR